MVGDAVSAAREEILARVRRALADVPAGERPEDAPVPRGYAEQEHVSARDRFVERVTEYRASVRTATPDGIAETVGEVCREHGVSRVAVPADLPPEWLPPGVEAVVDDALDAPALDEIGAAVTGCSFAIAETGTVVLDAGARQGRRALSLVVDLHVCVVEEGRIVDGVPTALRRLASGLRSTRRPVTLVSGPSATGDIEFTRIEGVHGPRRLELVLVRR
jgi:L-lactate dehydrogenase complex protein LldG